MIITFFSVLFLGIWTGLLSLVKGISPSEPKRPRAAIRDQTPVHREAPVPRESPARREVPIQHKTPVCPEGPMPGETPMHFELRRLAFAFQTLLGK